MSYWCSYFETYEQKQHAISVYPEITNGNEGHVIQIELLRCHSGPDENTTITNSTECPNPGGSDYISKCFKMPLVFIWGRGGGKFEFPSNVGLPFGVKVGEHFIMRVLYHNKEEKTGIIDKSGLWFSLTHNLRSFDAGILETGMVSDANLLVPPGQSNWTDHGYCLPGPDCLQFPKTGVSESAKRIKIIAALPRQSTAAKSIKTSIVSSSGKEMSVITLDNNYDFLNPQLRYVEQPSELTVDETLVTTCQFNSQMESDVLTGGNKPEDPACRVYLLYYPKNDAFICDSTNHNVQDFVEAEATKLCPDGDPCTYDWSGKVWNGRLLDRLKEKLNDKLGMMICKEDSGSVAYYRKSQRSKPEITIPLTLMNYTSSCNPISTSNSAISGDISSFRSILFSSLSTLLFTFYIL